MELARWLPVKLYPTYSGVQGKAKARDRRFLKQDQRQVGGQTQVQRRHQRQTFELCIPEISAMFVFLNF